MKRRLLAAPPAGIPEAWEPYWKDARVYDSSCSPEARVYFLEHRDGGCYLKTAPRGSLAREAEMTAYFHRKGLGAEVLEYTSEADADWLLTARVKGEDCTHATYLSEPRRLAELLGTQLRQLHEMDASDCPVQDRMGEYLALAQENCRAGRYDLSYLNGAERSRSVEDAVYILSKGKQFLKNEVLLHGDYCLPNVMLDAWQLSGFIDVDHGGVGDRHVDLFWGAWTLGFNLGTDRYRDYFLDAYGRDRIDQDLLEVVAAAEVFG